MSSPSADRLTPELASQFARIALGHVTREYPNKLDHVMTGPQDARGPRDLHPIFFGSYDWHSCVHGYWTLATVLRLHPEIPEAAQVRALFDEIFTTGNVDAEVAYLDRPSSRGFERPYGWAWLLKLQAELERHPEAWARTLRPLADAFEDRLLAFLPLARYPIRTGVHSSTAFALRLAWDYPAGEAALPSLIRDRAIAWHKDDRDANAWEPSLDDFLSPTLMTAALMSHVMAREAFRAWFAAYLPNAARQAPASLFTPAVPPDRSDGKMAHLDGVNLSRAWCWREIAAALDPADPVASVAEQAARAHLAASLPHVAGDYMGEHWLASFALLALTAP
ncbi:MAG: DUF2891 family protein [Phenylobacterium sp.]|uniref:DUF2891 domain-containing protein n=1 Tax=Phenylobacterium sp. TaxID=1871053 RepID=UPI0025CFE30A|nr:DUF2891 domain-containing protein [Phenylobacterium sp.]MBI1198045.1 DUF2891 family protein [Phenylobacterium sp.]